MRIVGSLLILLLAFHACKNEQKKLVLTPEQETENNIKTLKEIAQDGDLVVRLNDDVISIQLRNFNGSDKAFSHSGIVVTKGTQKMVCSVLPGQANTSPVVYAPLDSFIDPTTNISCALFRYQLTPAEKADFLTNINALSTKKIYFDSTFNINNDDSLYCSEMIYKTLKTATHDRLKFKLSYIPKKMQPMVVRFYRNRFDREKIARRQIMFIDNLYRIPECRELMRFKLKHFPGE